jgi:glycosyltransferase involved in cell wall biosynthesis
MIDLHTMTQPQVEDDLKRSTDGRDSVSPMPTKVAYMMSRFPRLTETFILYEILALEEMGIRVELYPLLREQVSIQQPEAAPLVERAHYQPFLSWPIVRAHARFLRRKPGVYFSTLWALLRGTWGSPNFFLGAVGIFPKTVYFAEMMEAVGIQHLHAHFANHPAAAAFVIRRLTGIPYSFTAHGSDLHVDRHMLREKVAEAALVVTISNYNRELIIKECGDQYRDKVAVVHCGVDTSVFQMRKRPPVDEIRSQFRILCIGTLHEVKGQTYLIEACRLLKERGIDVVCHLVGDGPDRKLLEQQIERAGLAGQVLLRGRQTRPQIAQLLADVDVTVAPSVPTKQGKREGIPVALMEAMGSGVPVVASHLSGIPELVADEHSGLLVQPRDAHGLAAALERLWREPDLRRRLGEAGRDTVAREFDLRTNAVTLSHLFRREDRS